MKKTLTALLLVVTAFGCGSDKRDDVLKNVSALVILQRAPRMGGVGDVFQYTSYEPGGKLLKLQPPVADGTLSTLCCDQFGDVYKDMDIQFYDVAYDARSIVFSGKLTGGERYQLFVLTLNDAKEPTGEPRAIASNPMHDYVYPFYMPLDRVGFVTNAVVEEGAAQHRDEYDRGTTTQLGSIAVDGTDEVLGPRNLSHRVAPSMMADGHIMFTQWDHLQDENSGHLMRVNPDFTNLHEVVGKEGSGRTNSYLKAVEVPTLAGEPRRLLTIGTARNRTLQSGKILDVRLGSVDADGTVRESEANASTTDLTPLVPGDNDPSQLTVGRYYDVYPIAGEDGKYGESVRLVVSWADGPVEEETLGAAGLGADFGIYVIDSDKGKRLPIYNDPTRWDVLGRPLDPRPAPAAIPSSDGQVVANPTGSLLIGALDVYNTSLTTDGRVAAPGEIYAVRVLEGFSTEEGIPRRFGLTNAEGAAELGRVLVQSDGSFAAYVPANVPIHLQPIDRFGLSLRNEPVWFSGRPGESRFCGGCHEDRARTTVIQPGIIEAIAVGPANIDRPRAMRNSTDFSKTAVTGVPWDQALQPIFDAKCVSCHNGVPGPANPSFTITDTVTGMMTTFVFDLSGREVNYGVGDAMMSGYSASHLSLIGPRMEELLQDNPNLVVSGTLMPQVDPGNGRESNLITKLNPPVQFPAVDTGTRFQAGGAIHPADVGGVELTADEYYLMILMADAGGQFYSRENAPGGGY